MTGLVPDAVDAVLLQEGSDPEGTLDEAHERPGSQETNTMAVVMGCVALAWRFRTHLARPDNNRESDRRHGRPRSEAWVPRARPWPRSDRQSQLSRRNQVFPVTGARPSWQGAGFFSPRAGSLIRSGSPPGVGEQERRVRTWTAEQAVSPNLLFLSTKF